MLGTIKIFTRERACELLLGKIMLAGGFKAKLFKSKLTSFLSIILARDFLVLGECDTAAAGYLSTQHPKNNVLRSGGLELYFSEYAIQMMLAQAEKHELPVALFKQELELFIDQLYRDRFIFAAPVTESVQKILLEDKTLQMELREKS